MVRFAGSISKEGRYWAIEIPALCVFTQAEKKDEIDEMIADAVETVVDAKGFKVRVFRGEGNYFEVGGSDSAELFAAFLRQNRQAGGLSLAQAAERLGSSSKTSVARYESGSSEPSISKMAELVNAVSGHDLVLGLSRVG